MTLPIVVQGFVLSLGLIVAIGAQNAFVLRQGLRREHVGSVVLFCAMADALLIVAGVLGLGQALGDHPMLTRGVALAGAVFLVIYGAKALLRARRPACLLATVGGVPARRAAVLAQTAAFTLLNPHVYLDTVLLMGSLGAQHAPLEQGWFILGASTASGIWFGALGYGARWLAPWFAQPRAWQILDGMIGLTLCGLAGLLLRHVAGGAVMG